MEASTTFSGSEDHVGDPVRLGIVTVSDRASRGEYQDEGGPAILGFFEAAIKSPWTALYRCVPDEREAVEAALIELVDEEGCHVVVTTGGTGPAPRAACALGRASQTSGADPRRDDYGGSISDLRSRSGGG